MYECGQLDSDASQKAQTQQSAETSNGNSSSVFVHPCYSTHSLLLHLNGQFCFAENGKMKAPKLQSHQESSSSSFSSDGVVLKHKTGDEYNENTQSFHRHKQRRNDTTIENKCRPAPTDVVVGSSSSRIENCNNISQWKSQKSDQFNDANHFSLLEDVHGISEEKISELSFDSSDQIDKAVLENLRINHVESPKLKLKQITNFLKKPQAWLKTKLRRRRTNYVYPESNRKLLLQDMMSTPNGRKAIFQIANKQYIEEIPKFIQSILEYQELPASEQFSKYCAIIEEFVKVGSSNEVNISSTLRDNLIKNAKRAWWLELSLHQRETVFCEAAKEMDHLFYSNLSCKNVFPTLSPLVGRGI